MSQIGHLSNTTTLTHESKIVWKRKNGAQHIVTIQYSWIHYYLFDSHLEQQKYKKWEGHHLRMNKKKEKKSWDSQISLGLGRMVLRSYSPISHELLKDGFTEKITTKNKVWIIKIKRDRMWPERANNFACFRDKGPAARMVLKEEIWLQLRKNISKQLSASTNFTPPALSSLAKYWGGQGESKYVA